VAYNNIPKLTEATSSSTSRPRGVDICLDNPGKGADNLKECAEYTDEEIKLAEIRRWYDLVLGGRVLTMLFDFVHDTIHSSTCVQSEHSVTP
jgi:hypothetical protein